MGLGLVKLSWETVESMRVISSSGGGKKGSTCWVPEIRQGSVRLDWNLIKFYFNDAILDTFYLFFI